MAKKKITRKQLLKKEDEFLTFSARVANNIRRHQHQLKIIGFAICVLILAYLGGLTYLNYVNKKGQELYNEAYNLLSSNMMPDADNDKLKKSEELFKKVIDEYALSKTASLALSQVGYLEYRDEKYDEAVVFYKKFLHKVSKDPYGALANLAIATCYESTGDLKKAIEILSPVANAKTNPFNEMAMLSLARLFRLDGQHEKAKETLKTFVQQHETSPFISMVNARL
ncbi:MAG TPA: tetratricopeptide repeat protein [Desulfobacteraceae bacterium]|mgnify:CR=1 FL=1|nr:tetratricopeptide repeat protein [Desulfobacteraceae bacterium]HPJ66546.1 tetratricopeptide repeat protein [Desulfobacteraceae bacterium]HPQ27488.1 tetratricopeptide repeat protein [Desulfobacteraceae bacterium]